MIPQKNKMNKLDFTKIKNVCFEKDSNKTMKRQATDSYKIFANRIFDKGLEPRIYWELPKLKKKKMQLEDRPTYEEAFHRKGYTDGKQACERRSTPLAVIKTWIKTASRSYYTYLLEQLKYIVAILNASNDVEKLDFSYITGGTIKSYSHSVVWPFL